MNRSLATGTVDAPERQGSQAVRASPESDRLLRRKRRTTLTRPWLLLAPPSSSSQDCCSGR